MKDGHFPNGKISNNSQPDETILQESEDIVMPIDFYK